MVTKAISTISQLADTELDEYGTGGGHRCGGGGGGGGESNGVPGGERRAMVCLYLY